MTVQRITTDSLPNPGVIYVLVNPSLEGLVKVGRTDGLATERARELSRATGVPTPFIVVFEAPFANATAAEAYVHARLTQRGYRLTSNREFFRSSPTEAIQAVLEAQKALSSATSPLLIAPDYEDEPLDEPEELEDWEPMTPENWDEDIESASMEAPFYSVFEAAIAAEMGFDETIEDHAEALRLYKQAAALGSVCAWRRMADIYNFDDELADPVKAMKCYREGASRGDPRCYAGMAGLYVDRHQLENAAKCWARYFSSRHFLTRRSGVGSCALEYVHHVKNHGLPFTHRKEIQIPQIMNAMRLREPDLSYIDQL